MPPRAVVVAYAAALQESHLHNLSYGDRDSVGVFQQRPSEGWGPARKLKDPVYASTRFFQALTSVPKYNTVACAQCHITGSAFENLARGDYDGNGSAEFVQLEIAGLRAALLTAVQTQLSTLVGSPATLTVASGKVKYTITGSGLVRVFPGPSVPSSDNPDILYNTLTTAQKAQWDALYAAAYDWVFVGNDLSEGVHNTGYAVNLLQSAYKAVTGTTIGTPFVPF
jgi:hypothetical protein